MDFMSDILLAAGAFSAAFYCVVLSRRLRRFTDLEQGVGGAVAVLSAQVDDLNKSLIAARTAAKAVDGKLLQSTQRAEAAATRLDLLVTSLHDLPEAPEPLAKRQPPNPYFRRSDDGRSAA